METVHIIIVCLSLAYWVDADPCLTYEVFNADSRRSPSHTESVFDNTICDALLSTKWYRLEGDAGTDLTNDSGHILSYYGCGTFYQLWMDGTIPAVADGIVYRQICLKTLLSVCQSSFNIQVKNCCSFRVYYLQSSSGCPEAYCVSPSIVPNETCPEATTTTTTTTSMTTTPSATMTTTTTTSMTTTPSATMTTTTPTSMTTTPSATMTTTPSATMTTTPSATVTTTPSATMTTTPSTILTTTPSTNGKSIVIEKKWDYTIIIIVVAVSVVAIVLIVGSVLVSVFCLKAKRTVSAFPLLHYQPYPSPGPLPQYPPPGPLPQYPPPGLAPHYPPVGPPPPDMHAHMYQQVNEKAGVMQTNQQEVYEKGGAAHADQNRVQQNEQHGYEKGDTNGQVVQWDYEKGGL